MSKKLPFLLLFIFSIIKPASSQAPNWAWAISACSLSFATNISAITTDPAGNIFIAGNFRDSAEFGSIVYHPTGTTNLFLAKYDSSGNYLWMRQARGANVPPYDLVTAICTDSSGNCYVTGFFNGIAVFDHDTVISMGSSPDVFVAKFNPNGSVLWLNQGRGPASDYAYGIGLDNSGYCYIAGSFESGVNFDNLTLTANSASNDIFISKLDLAGNFISAHGAGGSGTDLVSALDVDDNGNCYITGMFNSPEIDLGQDTINSTNTGFDAFVAKFDSAGNAIWGNAGSGPGNQEPSGIASNINGNCFMTGIFKGDTMFLDTTTLVTYGYYDFFTAKYDSTGSLSRADHQGSATFGTEFSSAIATDTSGNFYTTGVFRNPATFGQMNVTGSSALNVFITKFDTAANVEWVQQSGSASSSLSATAMHMDKNGNIYITGSFELSTTFGNDSLLVSPGYTAGYYIAKLSNGNTTGIQSQSSGIQSWKIFPNPAQDKLNITGLGEKSSVRIFDITGCKVYENESEGNQIVDVKDFHPGIYILEINSCGTVAWKKFIRI
ncbi:MAG: SBBP repeat-containing protein [Bacteroidota bacterium]